MGDTRARASRTNATALPMTRRQQKRARQQVAQTGQRGSRAPRPQQAAPVAASTESPTKATAPASAPPSTQARRSTNVAADFLRALEQPLARPVNDDTATGATDAARQRRARAGDYTRPARTKLTATHDAEQSEADVDPSAAVEVVATENGATTTEDDGVIEDAEAVETLAGETSPETPVPAKKYPTLAAIAARRPALTEPEQTEVLADEESDVATREVPAADVETVAEAPRPVIEWQRRAAAPQPAHDAAAPDAAPQVPTRRAVPTRRLQATRDDAAIASLRQATRHTDPSESASARHAPRPRPLPEVDLTLPVAGAHAAVAAVAALVGAALLVQGASGAVWALTLTAIAGAGGWLAYALGQQRRFHVAAGAVLMLSQLGILVWLLLIFGPRGALIALTPAIILLALRMASLRVAASGSVLAVGAYVTLGVLSVRGAVHPALRLTASAQLVSDIVAVTGGLAISLLALALWNRQRIRLDHQARARLREAHLLDTRATRAQERLDEDARRLADALSEALRGQGIGAVVVGDELQGLAETVELVAERLRTLQQDREDRLRIEGALRGLIREVERAWLGLPWVWPSASGTTLDELTALLRAPRSQETPSSWPDATPDLLPIPSAISQPTRPWDVVAYNMASRPSHPRETPYAQLPLGLDESDSMRALPAHFSQLPWHEWDTWRDWDPNQPQVVGE